MFVRRSLSDSSPFPPLFDAAKITATSFSKVSMSVSIVTAFEGL